MDKDIPITPTIDYTNDNTFVFTLARMNPPTPGHLYLIQRLIEEGIAKNVTKVYVILSKTNDNNEDPIPCIDKQSVLIDPTDTIRTMISSLKEYMISYTTDLNMIDKIRNMNITVICVPNIKGATPFTPLFSIVGSKQLIHDINLFLVIGEDRANMLDNITDVFFKFDNINSVDGLVLQRPDMGSFKKLSTDPEQLAKLNVSDIPQNALSASFVRNLVGFGLRDKFIELYSPYLAEDKINALYDSILQGVTSLPQKKQSTIKIKPNKYDYPFIKGHNELSVAKKRRIGGKIITKSRKSFTKHKRKNKTKSKNKNKTKSKTKNKTFSK